MGYWEKCRAYSLRYIIFTSLTEISRKFLLQNSGGLKSRKAGLTKGEQGRMTQTEGSGFYSIFRWST